MKVKQIFFNDITSISANTTIRRLIKMMILNRISCMPIVDELNKYLGGICDSVIIDASIPEYMKELNNTSFLPDIDNINENMKKILDRPVSEFMVKEYPTIKPDDSASYAADLMDKTGRTVLHVVDDQGCFFGYVNKFDLLTIAITEDNES